MNLVRRLIARLPGTQAEMVPGLKAEDGTPLAGSAELNRRLLTSQDLVNKPELLCEVAMHEVGEDMNHFMRNRPSNGDLGMNVMRLMRGEEIDRSLGEQDIKAVNGLRGEAASVGEICGALVGGSGGIGTGAGLSLARGDSAAGIAAASEG